VTLDGGLILVRELDVRQGPEKLIEERLSDPRASLEQAVHGLPIYCGSRSIAVWLVTGLAGGVES
jgi:hypothetical protein